MWRPCGNATVVTNYMQEGSREGFRTISKLSIEEAFGKDASVFFSEKITKKSSRSRQFLCRFESGRFSGSKLGAFRGVKKPGEDVRCRKVRNRAKKRIKARYKPYGTPSPPTLPRSANKIGIASYLRTPRTTHSPTHSHPRHEEHLVH